jgi:hypothetical protein
MGETPIRRKSYGYFFNIAASSAGASLARRHRRRRGWLQFNRHVSALNGLLDGFATRIVKSAAEKLSPPRNGFFRFREPVV